MTKQINSAIRNNAHKEYDAIISLSFGTGLSNKYLSDATWRIYNTSSKNNTIILQHEIADYFFSNELSDDVFIKVISEHRKAGKYLDTFEVLSQAKDFLKDDANIVLIAHSDHLPRVIYTAKKLGFKVTKVDIPNIPYDPKSKQIWTRNKWFFLLWEFIAYIYLYIKLWIEK